MTTAAIILAAGKGTRMSSDLPKVLHEVAGHPLLHYVVQAIRPVVEDRIYIVVGYRADVVTEVFAGGGAHFVLQEEQLGTGHAVQQAEAALEEFTGTVIVLNGDVPCLRTETIRDFVAFHQSEGAAATVLSAVLDDPTEYGRIIRDSDGALVAIVEQKDADEAQRGVKEINSGLFCFDKDKLFEALRSTRPDNVQGEHYLTDVIAILGRQGERVRAYCVQNSWEVAGVNNDRELEIIKNYLKD